MFGVPHVGRQKARFGQFLGHKNRNLALLCPLKHPKHTLPAPKVYSTIVLTHEKLVEGVEPSMSEFGFPHMGPLQRPFWSIFLETRKSPGRFASQTLNVHCFTSTRYSRTFLIQKMCVEGKVTQRSIFGPHVG